MSLLENVLFMLRTKNEKRFKSIFQDISGYLTKVKVIEEDLYLV